MAAATVPPLPPDDDPVALRSPALLKYFGHYLRWYFGRNFTAVRVAKGDPLSLAPDKAVIVFTNHPSWWDPILFVVLTEMKFPGRAGYGPMEAEALEQYRFFKRIGVFGVEPDTLKGAARFFAVSRHILADPKSVLWVTAEGTFRDSRARPIRLQSGIAHLAGHIDNATFLPMAIELTFWNERDPELLVRFGRAIDVDEVRDLDTDGRRRLFEDRLAETMDALAEAAIARDPERFETLIEGRPGVGVVYDGWRRLRAAVRGRAFSPRHQR